MVAFEALVRHPMVAFEAFVRHVTLHPSNERLRGMLRGGGGGGGECINRVRVARIASDYHSSLICERHQHCHLLFLSGFFVATVVITTTTTIIMSSIQHADDVVFDERTLSTNRQIVHKAMSIANYLMKDEHYRCNRSTVESCFLRPMADLKRLIYLTGLEDGEEDLSLNNDGSLIDCLYLFFRETGRWFNRMPCRELSTASENTWWCACTSPSRCRGG
ncbi:hypothetical protein ElyMa_002268200 [Elysia marginata]|uniref:Uncharacterized protein n=1 Tax=Elysia marginata TaxID=1093978 RepID=A0AAV4FZ67_9GAST|nr:hypothetical protein ElyMa_002268200 [Elysia marginata]